MTPRALEEGFLGEITIGVDPNATPEPAGFGGGPPPGEGGPLPDGPPPGEGPSEDDA